MNWCKPHWDMLRKKVSDVGLDAFVPKDGKAAAKSLVNKEFDPLMGSWLSINTAMLQSPALNGRMLQCPLCILVDDGQPEMVGNWLDGVTKDALEYAINEGLVKPPAPMQ